MRPSTPVFVDSGMLFADQITNVRVLFCSLAIVGLLHNFFRFLVGLPCFYMQHMTFKRCAFVHISIIQMLHKPRVFRGLWFLWICTLFLGAVFPTSRIIRIAIFSVFLPLSIIDVQNTCHRTFPMLYTLFAIAFFSDATAHAISCGACTHFFLASGLSKLLVGGTAWIAPLTMRTYLGRFTKAYIDGNGGLGGSKAPTIMLPLSKTLSEWFQKHDFWVSAIAASSIVYECGLTPALLFMSEGMPRCMIGVSLNIGFHFGIAMVQSLYVGADFIPCMPVYVYGLSAFLPHKSLSFYIALATSLSAVPWALFGELMPVLWPLDPIPLFSWSGDQCKVLDAWRGANSKVRIVMAAEGATAASIVGTPLYENGKAIDIHDYQKINQPLPEGVWDTCGHCFDLTCVEKGFLKAFRADIAKGLWEQNPKPSAASLAHFEEWLTKDTPLYTFDGVPLRKAFFIQVAQGKVSKVLLQSEPKKVV